MGKSQIIATDFDPAGPFAGLILPDRFLKRQSETRFKQRWQLTPLQYWRMMRESYALSLGRWLPSRYKQRGSIGTFNLSTFESGAAGSVSISAHTLTDSKFSSGSTDARIEFQNDGQLWAFRLIGSDFEYNGEWWTNEIEASIGDSYECRHLSSGKTGSFNSVEAAVANTWITITTGRAWGVQRNVNGTTSCTATFECGLDGVESALDSAVFTTTAILDFL